MNTSVEPVPSALNPRYWQPQKEMLFSTFKNWETRLSAPIISKNHMMQQYAKTGLAFHAKGDDLRGQSGNHIEAYNHGTEDHAKQMGWMKNLRRQPSG